MHLACASIEIPPAAFDINTWKRSLLLSRTPILAQTQLFITNKSREDSSQLAAPTLQPMAACQDQCLKHTHKQRSTQLALNVNTQKLRPHSAWSCLTSLCVIMAPVERADVLSFCLSFFNFLSPAVFLGPSHPCSHPPLESCGAASINLASHSEIQSAPAAIQTPCCQQRQNAPPYFLPLSKGEN